MIFTINGQLIQFYNQVKINLKYDSIADTFSALLYFDPNNLEQKNLFKPLTYPDIVISHGGVILMTGTVLNSRFVSAGQPPKTLVIIEGYSRTGILSDCNSLDTDVLKDPNGNPVLSVKLQFNNQSLKQIAETICNIFPLKVIIDDNVKQECNIPFPLKEMKDGETYFEFLDKIAKQKNIVLSHTPDGNLLLTRCNASALLTTSSITVKDNDLGFIANSIAKTTVFKPFFDKTITTGKTETITTSEGQNILYNFDYTQENPVWVEMELIVNGQNCHSVVQVVGENSNKNIADKPAFNPMIKMRPNITVKYAGLSVGENTFPKNTRPIFDQTTYISQSDKVLPPNAFDGRRRYKRVIQTSGNENDINDNARSILGSELLEVKLIITINSWTLNGFMVTPNQLITVHEPECYLYNKTKFFIQEVYLFGDEKTQYATLTCVLPEGFNEDIIPYIF